MPRAGLCAALTAAAVLGLTALTATEQRDRASVEDRFKWNLADIYPATAAWAAEKDALKAAMPALARYTGQLGTSSGTLADALDLMFDLGRRVTRVSVYAGMLADEDTRNATTQGMRQEIRALSAAYGSQVAYVEPEILRIDPATIERFLASEPRLKTYAVYLRDIARRAPHTLSAAEERILADAAQATAAPGTTFGILSNADLPYPTITVSDGRSVKVDQARFLELRASAIRGDRRAGMEAFFGALGGFQRTFGTTMDGSIQGSLFQARTRKYPSTLAMALNGPNIPAEVYTRLVDGINRHLPTFHRSLALRKRMMGLQDDMHYYDLYAPVVTSINLTYSPEDAQQHVLGALAPLGTDYTAVVRRAFDDRWLDWFPTEGKVAGAYSTGGAYDVHPYILLNYQGRLDDVGVLAHEMGHTVHSYLSNRAQPYATAGYPIFVAEVGSIFNEALFSDYMLKRITDEPTRLALLGSYLDNVRQTVFRQTQFAEFELRMHEMASRGEPITGASLAKLYLEVARKYYGHDRQIVLVDDYIAHEWSLVPHFYSDFYVFQYATSFTAAAALSARVLSGDAAARDAYLAFLASGGSDYPVELLKRAGVDMTTDEPLDLAMRRMNQVMDEIERILDRR
jgi:oligoendopeptidase F